MVFTVSGEGVDNSNCTCFFLSYSKEAQKCYCGSANCRGYIGGEKTQPLKPLNTDKVSKKKKEETKKKDYEFNNVDTVSCTPMKVFYINPTFCCFNFSHPVILCCL